MPRVAHTLAHLTVLSVVLLSSPLAGCTTAPGPQIDGGPTDVGPVACGTDVVCPAERPPRGARCLGSLSCTYPNMCTGRDAFVCADGVWVYEPDMLCLGGGPLPQAELCRTPSTAAVAGTLDLTLPSDRFLWGSQGGAMIQFDLALTGDAAALECVAAEVAVRVDGTPLSTPRLGLRPRCGNIAGVTIILTDQPCEDRMYEVVIDVDVAGVGTLSRTLMLRGGEDAVGRPVCPL